MIEALPEAEGVLQLENLSALSGIRHGFATRRGRLADVTPFPIARLHQVHDADVLELPDTASGREPYLRESVAERPAADALFTNQTKRAIAVSVADCLPILIADPEHRVVAAVHAGWRSLAAGVVENTVAAMASAHGTAPQDLVVGIGPAIGPCCFEVGEEVIEAFGRQGYREQARVPPIEEGERPHCNLVAVADAVLQKVGVPGSSIADAGLCTKCNSEWLWSYRADGESAGRMICGIALAPVV